MTRVVVSPEAEGDLLDLQQKIADAASDEIADRFVDRLLQTVRTLSIVPKASGRLVPSLGEGLRCHPFSNYNIYLKYDDRQDNLYLVHVLHGRRQITRDEFTR